MSKTIDELVNHDFEIKSMKDMKNSFRDLKSIDARSEDSFIQSHGYKNTPLNSSQKKLKALLTEKILRDDRNQILINENDQKIQEKLCM